MMEILDFSQVDGLLEIRTCVSYAIEFADDQSAGEAAKLYPAIFTQVSKSSGILNVQNYIGSYDFLGKQVKVTAGDRLSETDFDKMLTELVEKLAQLPFAYNTPTQTSSTPNELESADILYHSFLIVRHFFYDGEPTLEEAIEAILRNPARKAEREQEKVDIWEASHISGNNVQQLLYNQTDWIQLRRGHPLLETQAAKLNAESEHAGYFPQKVVQDRVVRSFDTVENRFVKGILNLCTEILERFRENLKWKSSVLQKQVLWKQCDEMLELMGQLAHRTVLANVGEMTIVPYQSTILQNREGYKEFLAFYHRLLGGLHLAIPPETMMLLIEQKDIAKLYELWTYVRMIDLVSEAVGSTPVQVLQFQKDDWQAYAANGLEVRYTWQGQTLKLIYNRTFQKGSGSYSLTLRPDVVLELGGRRFIFDAKFKLQHIQWETEKSDEQLEKSSFTFKNGDIYKMHTYKDAIRGAVTACIVYPNPSTHKIKFFPEQPGGFAGVGAIPMLPGRDGTEIVNFLKRHCLQQS